MKFVNNRSISGVCVAALLPQQFCKEAKNHLHGGEGYIRNGPPSHTASSTTRQLAFEVMMEHSVSRQERAAILPPTDMNVGNRLWWERERLRFADQDLLIAGHRVTDLAAQYGAPLYLYDSQRILDNVWRLKNGFLATGHPHQLYFACKANRFRPVIDTLLSSGVVGIDCSSPGEVKLALSAGCAPERISFTASAVSEEDIEVIGGLNIRINVDSISMIHKLGKRFPGRRIGIRVNPQTGAGATSNLTYAGARPSKFGIYADRFAEAIRLAASYDLIVEGVHMHVGSGWLEEGTDQILHAVERLCGFAAQVPDLRYINVGGGIGVCHSATDEAVDVNRYASTIVSIVRDQLGHDVQICCEPGDYLVNDSAILVAKVTMVEEKGGELFVGLNAGFNVNPQAAHYGFHHEVVHTSKGPADASTKRCCVVGNINEVIDTFNANSYLPDIREGDHVVVLNAGGYGSSMSSYHCLREPAKEVLL